MNIEKKNLPESVYSRLKNIALAKNRDSFLKGIGHDPMPFEKVIFEIRDFFLPILIENNAQVAVIS